MTKDTHTKAHHEAPSSSGTALTRPSDAFSHRTLDDLTDEELRILAAIAAHERPTWVMQAIGARVPLAIAAAWFIGAGALFWAGVGPGLVRTILCAGALSGGFATLVWTGRVPRFGALAPAVAFLDERGVASRPQKVILRRLFAATRNTPVVDVDDVYRCLVPWGARDDIDAPAQRRAHHLPAALVKGIAREWVSSRQAALLLSPSILLLLRPALNANPVLGAAMIALLVGAMLVQAFLPMRRAFIAPFALGLDDGEEERLVQAFNDALKETRRERRRLTHDGQASVIVQVVSALLGKSATTDPALDDEHPRLLHDQRAETVPSAGTAPTAAARVASRRGSDGDG
jgi:hypothetical protein